jgi:tripartite ATP-independent transporter DctM subunit
MTDLEPSLDRPSRLATYIRPFRQLENLLISLTLALMVLLPLTESFLRKFFHTGISGSTVFVQHLVLYVGMLGGALAAREKRLLSLGTVTNYLREPWKSAATVFSSSFAAAMTFALLWASIQFILAKYAAGEVLPYNIRAWIVLLVLPIGFGLTMLRMVRHASNAFAGRLLALILAGVVVAFGSQSFIPSDQLVLPALITLVVATMLGAPVFTLLGGTAMILFWGSHQPIAMVPIDYYRLTVDSTLPTIPLFTLAGYFLAEGGAARRLTRLFLAFFGHFRGGPAIIAVLLCAFFTSFTGASGVTIIALGGLLMPILLAAGYSERKALGLLTGGGSLGILFPPCLPLILYAVVATTIGTEISIRMMFLGGIAPGILLVILTALWGIRCGPRNPVPERGFNFIAAWHATWEAKWELLLPVVALGTLFGGFATPVESAAITALYAFFVETVVYRDLTFTRDVPRVMSECGLLVGGVLLILGVAMGLTDYLFTANVPERLVTWAKEFIHAPWMFLLMLNVFLLVVGCLMDIFSAIVVVAPLIIPMGREFGIDPVHLGVIFLANLEVGFLTPPIGMNLFLSSYRFNKPMSTVIHSIFPMLAILFVGVLIITYAPGVTKLIIHLVS